MSQPFFQVRGVIEGFYGPFYTFPERNSLLRYIGRLGYNYYIYAPKNDRQHRARWWEPYPPEIMDHFAETVAIAARAGVTFCYAISPIGYSGNADFERVTAKLRAFYNLGVRAFSVMVDDINLTDEHRSPAEAYQLSAELHAELCNRLYDWLTALDPGATLSMCPTDYSGTAPFSRYLRVLGEQLHPQVDVFYTGPEICSPSISTYDVEDYAQVVRRSPIIWDNYPVNDLHMRQYLHSGPIRGRDADLWRVSRGIVVNPMTQAEASKIALRTFADYFSQPYEYEPWGSWERALLAVGGRTSFSALRQFAENSLFSCLGAEAVPLETLGNAVVAALERGEQASSSPAVTELAGYLEDLDNGCYYLKFRMPNLRLRQELLPWIEALEDWLWAGRRALLLLQQLEAGEDHPSVLDQLHESLANIRAHHKRIAGQALWPLVQYALRQTEQPVQR